MIQTVDFVPGDTVNVHQKISEGEKTRVQVFKGVVIQIRGRGANKMFTVLKKVGQVSVERIWPINSPLLIKIDIAEKPKSRVRRAKLNHLKFSKVRP